MGRINNKIGPAPSLPSIAHEPWIHNDNVGQWILDKSGICTQGAAPRAPTSAIHPRMMTFLYPFPLGCMHAYDHHLTIVAYCPLRSVALRGLSDYQGRMQVN